MMNSNPKTDDERVFSDSDCMSYQKCKTRMMQRLLSAFDEMERLQAKYDWWDKMEPHIYRTMGLVSVIVVVLMVYDLSK